MIDERSLPAAARFYRATVFHARLKPADHRFTYKVLSLAIDLDRLDEAGAVSPLFSTRRFNLLGFSMRDHGQRDGSDLRRHCETLLAAAGVPAPTRIILVCFPRILGFVFNPISIYYCLNETGGIAALIYEVRNTFGEHHSYVVPTSSGVDGAPAPHERDKLFYVSPFMDMPMRYRFRTEAPDSGLRLKIIERDSEGVILTALIRGEEIAPRAGALLRSALASPLLGLKVLAGIHFEAARLWIKGLRIRTRPAAPALASFNEPGPYSAIAATPGQAGRNA